MDNDTLPQWLHHRFGSPGQWDSLSEGDRQFWSHEAQAVRRAVARNGFKVTPTRNQGVNR